MNNLDPLMSSARTGDSSKDEWRTPPWLYTLLDREFHFTLDPAATAENRLCDNWFSREEKTNLNGLTLSWESHTAFVNPPYSQLKKWVKKGYNEALIGNATVVMLVPARTDTRAWWDYVRHGEVRFLKGRLVFEGAKNSAPFPSAIVVFRKNFRPENASTSYWNIARTK